MEFYTSRLILFLLHSEGNITVRGRSTLCTEKQIPSWSRWQSTNSQPLIISHIFPFFGTYQYSKLLEFGWNFCDRCQSRGEKRRLKKQKESLNSYHLLATYVVHWMFFFGNIECHRDLPRLALSFRQLRDFHLLRSICYMNGRRCCQA